MKQILKTLGNLSTIKKILFGFGFVVSIASIPGLFSTIKMSEITSKNDLLISEKIPLQQAALKVDMLLAEIGSDLKAVILKTKKSQQLEERIAYKISNLNLLLVKMRDGSNSKNAKKIQSLLKDKESLSSKLILPPQKNLNIKNQLDEIILNDFKAFKKSVTRVLNTHSEKIDYHLRFNGHNYTIPSFASKAFIDFRAWVSSLEKAVKYNVPFRGETDGKNIDFERWYQNATINDTIITKKLKKISGLTHRIYRIAKEVDKAPAAEKIQKYNTQSNTDFKRYENAFSNLITQSTNSYNQLSKNEEKEILDSEIISKKMKGKLTKLDDTIMQDVNQAQKSAKSTADEAKIIIMLAILLCAGLSIMLALIISTNVTSPLNRITGNMKKLSKGSLDIDITGIDRKDEIGDMYKAMNIFKQNMIERQELEQQQQQQDKKQLTRSKKIETIVNVFDQEITAFVDNLSESITEMQNTSNSLNTLASQGANNSDLLKTASENVSLNVESVASASEELSVTSQSVFEQIKNTNSLISEAVKKTDVADHYAEDLTISSNKVQDVLGMIKDISEQINLLALNATIESARAGDAGKGFAVVASEVKNLAGRTNHSIKEIQIVMDEVKEVSSGMSGALKEVKDIVENVSEISNNIANAVNEQSTATNEIASTMLSINTEAQSVTKTVSQVSSDAQKTGNSSSTLKSASDNMGYSSQTLREKVKKFFIDIKTA